MREALVARKTKETDISLRLDLDGGAAEIDSGVGFFDHMLTLFAAHGGFGLTLRCRGDIQVDAHHSVEDVGICLGQAFRQALGDKRGVARYGDITLPMDEALVLAAADLSGRGMLCYDIDLAGRRVGSFDTELVEEFFTAFAANAGVTLHLRQLAGRNTHHIAEAAFKAAARALAKAARVEGDALPSTKGVLA